MGSVATSDEDAGEDEAEGPHDADGVNDPEFDFEPFEGWAGIHRLVRMQRGHVHIDVFSSCTESALLPITYFWSTAVMTYLGPHSWGCAYPMLSIDHRCLVTPVGRPHSMVLTGQVARHIKNYQQRGYNIAIDRYAIGLLPHGEYHQAVTHRTLARRFEDRLAFRVAFGTNTTSIDAAGITRSSTHQRWTVEWNLGGHLGHVAIMPNTLTIDHAATGEIHGSVV